MMDKFIERWRTNIFFAVLQLGKSKNGWVHYVLRKLLGLSSIMIVHVSFGWAQLPQFSITATAGTHGSISPSGTVMVDSGSNQSYAITPDPGYYIESLYTDTGSVGGSAIFAFNNVTSNHSISAAFSANAARGYGMLELRDDFNRPVTVDLSTSPSPFKWVKLLNQNSNDTTSSLQINSDSSISAYASLGMQYFAGVAWDSLLTDTTQIGLVVKQKSGNGSNSSFFIYMRMNNKDFATGDGYRLKVFYNFGGGGTDQIVLQRVANGGGTTVDLAMLNRNIEIGDTLVVKVDADKTMKGLIYGANGIRDSISALDNTYDPSLWYCWLIGFTYTPPITMDNFLIGKIPQVEIPRFVFSQTSLNFGSVSDGSFVTDRINVSNSGTLPLTISSVVSNHGQFTVTPTDAVITPSGSQIFSITFAPQTNGLQQGKIIFTHNALNSPGILDVNGIGTGASIPTITSFTPTSGPIGTAVTIAGINFTPSLSGNVVSFGATRAIVSAATSTSITVSVPSGATYEPITVETNGLIASSQNPFVVTFESNHIIDSSSFSPKTDYTAEKNPHFVMSIDVDGDGKPDPVLINGVSNTLSVYRNIHTSGLFSSSSLAPPVDFLTASDTSFYSIQMAAGDIDGDGKTDMVVVNFNGNFISVLKNTSTPGNISFAGRVDVPTGPNPVAVALGDLDGDGKTDMCVANNTIDFISVFKNTSGGGSITFAPRVDLAARHLPAYVAIKDIDNDGKPDLIAAAMDGGVSIYRNSSIDYSMSFEPKTDFITGPTSQCVAAGDFDGDGKSDLAVTNLGSKTISVLRNVSTVGNIVMNPKVDFDVDIDPIIITLGDLDGDGKLDMAAINQISSSLSILKNTSLTGSITSGSFAPKVDFITGYQPRAVAIGDLNSDGRPDVMVGNEFGFTMSLYLNTVSDSPIFNVAPNSLTFGSAVVGSSKQDSVTVMNEGSTPLVISSVVIDSSFFSVTPVSGTIAPSSSQKFYFTITPNSTGTKTGQAIFTHNAPGLATTLSLSGTGVSQMDTIFASAGVNGSIDPSGLVLVGENLNQAFTFTPAAGYHVDSLFVDDVYAGNAAGYTFNNVQGNHTILVKFAINTFTITATAGAHGSITPSGTVMVNYGASQSFSFTPATGYHVDSLIVDGALHAPVSGFTFTNDTSSHTIKVTFAINQFTIEATAGANGSINPSGSVIINYGGDQTFTFTPVTGYHVDSIIVDGVNQLSAQNYTFTNDTSNHTIRVIFAINVFTISASAGSNGSISPSGSVSVNYGASQTFTFSPAPSYHVDSLIVDGSQKPSSLSFTFTNDTSNHTIKVTFAFDFVLVNLKIMLQGPFTSGTMNTTLRTAGYLPLFQPYSGSPWNYTGPEHVTTVPSGVVDWILVDIRTGTTENTTIGSEAGFVKSNGTIVQANGADLLKYVGVPAGNYYIVVHHRNHLSVMSSSAVSLNDTSSVYDFTSGLSKYFGGDAANLGSGVFGMRAGDYSTDGFIDGSDFLGPDNQRFLSGYRQADLNLDGFVDGSDFISTDNNRFKGTKVPN